MQTRPRRYAGLIWPCLLFLALGGGNLAAGGPPAPPHRGASTQGAVLLRCRNPVSGVSWNIPVDLRSGTVDSFPATITPRIIAWHDRTHGGSYRFDRASGVLTVILPSSTGGFSLHDNCRFLP